MREPKSEKQAWFFKKAEQIAEKYANNPQVKEIIVGAYSEAEKKYTRLYDEWAFFGREIRPHEFVTAGKVSDVVGPNQTSYSYKIAFRINGLPLSMFDTQDALQDIKRNLKDGAYAVAVYVQNGNYNNVQILLVGNTRHLVNWKTSDQFNLSNWGYLSHIRDNLRNAGYYELADKRNSLAINILLEKWGMQSLEEKFKVERTVGNKNLEDLPI